MTRLLVALGLLLAACGPEGSKASTGDVRAIVKPGDASLPVTVDSADGRRVTVRDTRRIIPLWDNLAEVVFALGLGDRVVARDTSTTFAQARRLPLITRAHDVTAESVLSLRPTLILADEQSGPPEALRQIRDVGVPVVVFRRPTRVEEIAAQIRSIAAALGVRDAGGELAAKTTVDIDAVRHGLPRRAKRPRVAFLYLRGNAGVSLIAGPGSGVDSMIRAAGGSDAGTAIHLVNPFTPLTSEALVKAQPDVILMTTTGLKSVGGINGLLDVPGVAQTPAGRDRRVVTMEDGLLFSFGTRTAHALRTLADAFYES
ncbi:MAG TPA: ABC transporter substrate-binding protein [Acidimicrobiales bacterium]|nr:ABC transporter substrate-binding protein [Acidimicrobiales bacterium]